MSSLLRLEYNVLPDYDLSCILGQTQCADFDFHALGDALDCQRYFYGAGIIYNDGFHSYLVRPSHRPATSGQNQITHVVVTKVNHLSREEISGSVKKTVAQSSIGTEIKSTLLSCGALVLTAVACVVASGAVPLTAGTSTPLAIMAAAGTAATAVQCGNGLWRLYDIEFNDAKGVTWVDTQEWYLATSTALDLISLASLAGPLKEVVMTYRAMKSASSMKVFNWLKRYSRMERVRLTEGIIKYLNPGISNKVMKAMIRAGKYPRRFPTNAVRRELAKQMISVITSAMAISGSKLNGVIHSPESISASGEYVFGLLQSMAVVN